MSKLIIEAEDERGSIFELMFLSDYKNDEPEIQIDLIDDTGKSRINEQITFNKNEAKILIKYLQFIVEA